MKVEHIGIWVRDLEKMRHFYESFFLHGLVKNITTRKQALPLIL